MCAGREETAALRLKREALDGLCPIPKHLAPFLALIPRYLWCYLLASTSEASLRGQPKQAFTMLVSVVPKGQPKYVYIFPNFHDNRKTLLHQ